MVDVRCKQCRKLLFKAGENTAGPIEIDCKRCGRRAQITLPLRNPAEAATPPAKTTVAASP